MDENLGFVTHADGKVGKCLIVEKSFIQIGPGRCLGLRVRHDRSWDGIESVSGGRVLSLCRGEVQEGRDVSIYGATGSWLSM